jgi:protein SCO1
MGGSANRWRAGALGIALLAAAACGRNNVREYVLHGQVTAVHAERREITIRHQDIKGFMPAMTMPFKVRDARLLQGRRPGDLVQATLAVEDTDAWISALVATGAAPLAPEDAAPRREAVAPGDRVPDVSLVDQDGRSISVAGYRGHALVLTFVYTRCPLPAFCPTVDQRFVALQRAIAREEDLKGTRLLSISIDPAFDRPDVLTAHARRLGIDTRVWTLATGEPEAIDRFGGSFGLAVTRGAGTPEDLEHNLRTAVVNRDGHIVQILTGTNWQVDTELLDRIREAAR